MPLHAQARIVKLTLQLLPLQVNLAWQQLSRKQSSTITARCNPPNELILWRKALDS